MTPLLATLVHNAKPANPVHHMASAFGGWSGLLTGRRAIRERSSKKSKLSSGDRADELDLLCRFIDETTTLDPHHKPGPQLASILQRLFQLESVGIFDVDLDEIYQAGEPFENLTDTMRNICIFGTVS